MKYKVTLNNKVYEVVVEKGEAIVENEYVASASAIQPASAPTQQASAPVATGSGEAISAPFAGSVVNVCKSVGDTVKYGEPMVVIEAMKMENEISAPHDGKITAIYVNKGQSVEKGTPLVSLA